jgi:hypothetical protein
VRWFKELTDRRLRGGIFDCVKTPTDVIELCVAQ